MLVFVIKWQFTFFYFYQSNNQTLLKVFSGKAAVPFPTLIWVFPQGQPPSVFSCFSYLLPYILYCSFLTYHFLTLSSRGSIGGHSPLTYALFPLQLLLPLPIQCYILVKTVVTLSLLWPWKHCSVLRKREAIIIPPFLYNSSFLWY